MSDEPDEDEEWEDGLAALRASIDQMVSLAPEQARAAWGLYSAFLEVGFDEDQAFTVVMVYVEGWS